MARRSVKVDAMCRLEMEIEGSPKPFIFSFLVFAKRHRKILDSGSEW